MASTGASGRNPHPAGFAESMQSQLGYVRTSRGDYEYKCEAGTICMRILEVRRGDAPRIPGRMPSIVDSMLSQMRYGSGGSELDHYEVEARLRNGTGKVRKRTYRLKDCDIANIQAIHADCVETLDDAKKRRNSDV